MGYFENLFEQILKETSLVKFIKKLMREKIVNKFILIPNVNTQFDGNYLMIEFNGKLYSWFIVDKKVKSDYIEKSNDSFSNYKQCIENLINILEESD